MRARAAPRSSAARLRPASSAQPADEARVHRPLPVALAEVVAALRRLLAGAGDAVEPDVLERLALVAAEPFPSVPVGLRSRVVVVAVRVGVGRPGRSRARPRRRRRRCRRRSTARRPATITGSPASRLPLPFRSTARSTCQRVRLRPASGRTTPRPSRVESPPSQNVMTGSCAVGVEAPRREKPWSTTGCSQSGADAARPAAGTRSPGCRGRGSRARAGDRASRACTVARLSVSPTPSPAW